MKQSKTNVLIHVVFGTSGRVCSIPHDRADKLYAYMVGIAAKLDCFVVAIGGMPDHVHILLRLASTVTISDVVGQIKGSASYWINKTWDLAYRFEWQSGFGAFSVSESQSKRVAAYILNQARHHKGVAYEQELNAFLERNKLKE